MKRFQLLLTSLLATFLTACSSVNVLDYSNAKPPLVLEEFFNGDLVAHGMVKNRSGKVTRRFKACINASWENNVGTLDEYFIFDDGGTQNRIWKLTPNGNGRYRAAANDIVGSALLDVAGNTAFMNYTLEINYRGNDLTVDVDDRLYRVSEDIIINESTLTKFGVNVGSLLLTISKGPTARQNRPDCSRRETS